MSSNYLNAELFLFSFHLCLLPLSTLKLSFSLCLSVSHMCFLCLFSLCPASPPSLSHLLSLSSFFPSSPFLCPVPVLLSGFPTPLGPGFVGRAVGAWAKAGGKIPPPPPQGPYLPGLGSQGEFTFPAAPAWVWGIFPIWPPRAPILWPEAP